MRVSLVLSMLVCLAAKASAFNVLARAIPTTFWLLQGDGQDMTDDVALCSRCCESKDAAALEASLVALASSGQIAVECEPITLPDDSLSPPSEQSSNSLVLEGGMIAEEITAMGPRSFLLPGGKLVRVNEFDFEDGGTGSRVWDAAIAMSTWISSHEDQFRGKSVLELGSGTGLCGLSAALAGAAVTLSDMAAVAEPQTSAALSGGSAAAVSTAALLPNLEANACLNGIPLPDASDGAVGSARTQALNWETCFGVESAAETYDVVIGSDVVYEGFAVTALAAALVAHTAPEGTAILMSASSRFADASGALLAMLEAKGTVKLDKFTIHNSFGNTELVMTTWRKAAK